jgi:hypothetical protein
MLVKLKYRQSTSTVPHPPHAPPAPFKKDEQEVRRKHDIAPSKPHDITPPKHHDPEEEGVLGEADRPQPPSEKPEAD